jgi:chromosome segregation ATPase
LKADLGASHGELEDTKNRLHKVDEAKVRLETQVEREQRDRQALSDRVSLLDDELEEALAKNESLQDEVTRLKTTAKRATDELMAMKRQKAELETQFADKEESLFKKMEEQKSTIVDERQKVKAELEQAKKERDDVKARYADLHKKADTLLKRAKDGEQAAKERADGTEQRLNELVNDLRVEKEGRAREKALAEAAQEKLQKQLADATLKSSSDAEGRLETVKQQLKERDEKLARLTVEASQYRERAREALSKAKELEGQLAGAGNDETNKRAIDELKAKYNDVVGRLKTQTDNNKQVNEKYRDLADKYRKAVAIIDELKKRAAGNTGKPAPAAAVHDAADDDDSMPTGEATVVLQNPLAKKP